MTNSMLAILDGIAVAAFQPIGLADAGTYTAPDGAVSSCGVIIDYDIAKLGEIAEVNDRVAIVTLFKSDIARPVPRAVVTVGAMTYALDRRSSEDDSRSIWIARYGN